MYRYKLKIAYNGAKFCGWQSQRNNTTIQEAIESYLSVFLRHKVTLLGASRTDSGVHALDQIACFKTPKSINKMKFLSAMKGLLPQHISVMSIEDIDNDFHPSMDAISKVYRYQIWLDHLTIDPFLRSFVWQMSPKFSIEIFKKSLLKFVGKRNFKSFCAGDSNAKTFVRSVTDIRFEQDDQLLKIYISGTGFLKQMVRSMVGTSVDMANGRLSDRTVEEILEKEDRCFAGRTAPAQGLCLYKIIYSPSRNI